MLLMSQVDFHPRLVRVSIFGRDIEKINRIVWMMRSRNDGREEKKDAWKGG